MARCEFADRLFSAVDNHAAIKIGDLQRETRSKKVVQPRFTTVFQVQPLFGKAQMSSPSTCIRCSAHLYRHHVCGK